MFALRGSGGACHTDELAPKARNALANSTATFARWQQQADHIPHPDLAEMVLEESGYTDMLKADKSPGIGGATGKPQRARALRWESFESLTAFLEHVSLVMELEQNEGNHDRLNLMTLHAPRGSKFETYSLPGWEEGLFPSQRTLDEKGMAGLEEERRLAYVGLTRAKSRVFVSLCGQPARARPMAERLPSLFIGELPEAHVDNIAKRRILRQLRRSGFPRQSIGVWAIGLGLRHHGRVRQHLFQPRLAPRPGSRANMRGSSPIIEARAKTVATSDPDHLPMPSASASSIRNSAMAASSRWRATSCWSISRKPAPSASWTASSARHDFRLPFGKHLSPCRKIWARTSHRCSS